MPNQNYGSGIGRRKAVKTIGTGLVGSTGISALTGSAAASSDWDETYSDEAAFNNGHNHTSDAYGLGGTLGVELENYDSSNNQFDFGANGNFYGSTGNTDSNWAIPDEDDLDEAWNGITTHVLKIEDLYNVSIRSGADRELLGALDGGAGLADVPDDDSDKILSVVGLGAGIVSVLSGGYVAAGVSLGASSVSTIKSLVEDNTGNDLTDRADARYELDTSGRSAEDLPETNYIRWSVDLNSYAGKFKIKDAVYASGTYFRRVFGFEMEIEVTSSGNVRTVNKDTFIETSLDDV